MRVMDKKKKHPENACIVKSRMPEHINAFDYFTNENYWNLHCTSYGTPV